jgi:hypothetical protein
VEGGDVSTFRGVAARRAGYVSTFSRAGCAGRATFLRFRGDVAAARDRRAVSGKREGVGRPDSLLRTFDRAKLSDEAAA